MTTIEKAARAVAAEWYCETGHDPEAVAAAEGQWKAFESLARAALQAIREPETGAKILARLRTDGTLDYEADDGATWTAIITAILEEKPE